MNNMEREKVKAITPEEVSQEIPDYVIIGANECIKEHYIEDKKCSHFTQDELIEKITDAYYRIYPLTPMNSDTLRAELFKKHYLDIEPIYRAAGWIVKYDKPAYCESYDANFTFSKNYDIL